MNLFAYLAIALTAAALIVTGEQMSSIAIAADNITVAKANSKKPAKAPAREKTIVREKVYKGDTKKVDFEAIDIGGERKTPFGSAINQNKAAKEYDLIKIRLRWHPEMIQSTSSLETGRTK